MKAFGEQLIFCNISSSVKFQSMIVFSSAVDLKTAVKEAFLLGSSDGISDELVSISITRLLRVMNSYPNSNGHQSHKILSISIF